MKTLLETPEEDARMMEGRVSKLMHVYRYVHWNTTRSGHTLKPKGNSTSMSKQPHSIKARR